ncbi:hypothetical protein PR048_003379 [Dryococelus australis]|uniref:Uncharacterized protein n=1 Tax=Dryococelus australis TaxID=614101 RepID=A0ABQ9IMX7_9NEOP|nr:hypothetical protein PR048_003379 [Dryococelus australis]
MRPMAMLILHNAAEYTTCVQVDVKQGFQKYSFYREPPISFSVATAAQRRPRHDIQQASVQKRSAWRFLSRRRKGCSRFKGPAYLQLFTCLAHGSDKGDAATRINRAARVRKSATLCHSPSLRQTTLLPVISEEVVQRREQCIHDNACRQTKDGASQREVVMMLLPVPLPPSILQPHCPECVFVKDESSCPLLSIQHRSPQGACLALCSPVHSSSPHSSPECVFFPRRELPCNHYVPSPHHPSSSPLSSIRAVQLPIYHRAVNHPKALSWQSFPPLSAYQTSTFTCPLTCSEGEVSPIFEMQGWLTSSEIKFRTQVPEQLVVVVKTSMLDGVGVAVGSLDAGGDAPVSLDARCDTVGTLNARGDVPVVLDAVGSAIGSLNVGGSAVSSLDDGGVYLSSELIREILVALPITKGRKLHVYHTALKSSLRANPFAKTQVVLIMYDIEDSGLEHAVRKKTPPTWGLSRLSCCQALLRRHSPCLSPTQLATCEWRPLRHHHHRHRHLFKNRRRIPVARRDPPPPSTSHHHTPPAQATMSLDAVQPEAKRLLNRDLKSRSPTEATRVFDTRRGRLRDSRMWESRRKILLASLVFSGISHFSIALAFRRCSILTSPIGMAPQERSTNLRRSPCPLSYPPKCTVEARCIPGEATPGFLNVIIVPGDDAGRRVFSEISRFPRSCIPAVLNTHLTSPLPALKTSMLRWPPG